MSAVFFGPGTGMGSVDVGLWEVRGGGGGMSALTSLYSGTGMGSVDVGLWEVRGGGGGMSALTSLYSLVSYLMSAAAMSGGLRQ